MVALEVRSGFSKGLVGHKVLAVNHLRALLHETVFKRLEAILHLVLRLFVPINLELGHSRLFRQNVPGKSGDVGSGGWVIIHLLIIVFNIHVVSHS